MTVVRGGMDLVRKLLICMTVFAMVPTLALAQFPFTTRLDATSGIAISSPPTRPTATYRITVEGTYSQWPQFTDCHGVDAAWVYDVPQEEIDAFRWPPKRILTSPFVEIPHWVGDSTVWAFPPKSLGLTPLFEISFRKNLGFRVNGEPLPAQPLNRSIHRYQIEKAGTGSAFVFQILDSTFNIAQQRTVARYEDNCGGLKVTVEEILPEDINLCNVEKVVSSGRVVGLKIDASILASDTNAVDGRVNRLREANQLGIAVNGRFICPDSIRCDQREAGNEMSAVLVVDNSGSMRSDISYENETITRMDAIKRALTRFINRMHPSDSACVIRFNDVVELRKDWTSNKQELITTVNDLNADGNTAFYDALSVGLAKARVNSSPNRFVIAMTDGVDNRSTIRPAQLVDAITQANIPIYLVALGFKNDPNELKALDTMRSFVAAAPRGKVFQIDRGAELDSLYGRLISEISEDECCTIYFTLPDCDPTMGSQKLQIVYVANDTLLSRSVVYSCDPVVTGVEIDPDSYTNQQSAIVQPTPTADRAEVIVLMKAPGKATLELIDATGSRVRSIEVVDAHEGLNRIGLDTQDLSRGVYYGRIMTPQGTTTFKLLIQR